MDPMHVSIETGEKKTFAGALDYPGWCRSAKDDTSALRALFDYGSRYASALKAAGIDFLPPGDLAELVVVEHHAGNTTTDFGSPAVPLAADSTALEPAEYERQRLILLACWGAFEATVQLAEGVELSKGPRGGGRDLAEITAHVLEAERAYLNKLGWKHPAESGFNPAQALDVTRQSVLSALQAAQNGELPRMGPRGGLMWSLRFYLRRSAWHLLDHAWEIEDRS